jgi:hypothetical protein
VFGGREKQGGSAGPGEGRPVTLDKAVNMRREPCWKLRLDRVLVLGVFAFEKNPIAIRHLAKRRGEIQQGKIGDAERDQGLKAEENRHGRGRQVDQFPTVSSSAPTGEF